MDVEFLGTEPMVAQVGAKAIRFAPGQVQTVSHEEGKALLACAVSGHNFREKEPTEEPAEEPAPIAEEVEPVAEAEPAQAEEPPAKPKRKTRRKDGSKGGDK